MIKVNIDFDKIDESRIVDGRKGRYMDLVLVDHPSDYGDGFVTQDPTKEERAQKVRLPIIGNWKHVQFKGGDQPPQPQRPQRPGNPPAKATPPKDPDLDDDGDSIPF